MRRGKNVYCFNDVQIITHMSRLIRYFIDMNYVNRAYMPTNSKITIPSYFSFKKEFDASVIVFKQILSEFIYGKRAITIDFSKCKGSDIANFTMLNILIANLEQIRQSYNQDRYAKVSKNIKIITSLHDAKTNKFLAAFKYHELESQFFDGGKYMPLEPLRGKKVNAYQGNYKSITASKIAEFVKKAAEPYGYELTESTRKAVELYVTEVLNNAEDHSLERSEWFVNGICFNENQHDTNIIELNLAIMNIGLSMYEGFEETKERNITNYNKVQKIYNHHKNQFTVNKNFERESLFMLYMLNDGISRLKYQDESRGNGTMSFIEAFLQLGDYGFENNDFEPHLHVISGHSIITCDSQYAPYKDGTMHVLSLNKEKDIRCLPDKRNLQYNREYLPGTILECKIYLNKEHIINSINHE